MVGAGAVACTGKTMQQATNNMVSVFTINPGRSVLLENDQKSPHAHLSVSGCSGGVVEGGVHDDNRIECRLPADVQRPRALCVRNSMEPGKDVVIRFILITKQSIAVDGRLTGRWMQRISLHLIESH